MDLSKRSKRSSDGMCLGSNKVGRRTAPIQFFFIVLFMVIMNAAPAFSDSGVITVTGTGKDTGEAIAYILRSIVTKHFRSDATLVSPILQNEILPNAASFVQSYKMADSKN